MTDLRYYHGKPEGNTTPPAPWGYFDYDQWPSREPSEWEPAKRGVRAEDLRDFHVDLGCGRVPKGRIGVDRYPARGVNVVADFDHGETYWIGRSETECDLDPYNEDGLQRAVLSLGLPFEDSSIRSMVTHHCLEHVGPGFMRLMDECYRVLMPGAAFRIIVPLFPSTAAVEDPDHKRYFMRHSFDGLCGTPGELDDPQSCWLASFSVPYSRARFQLIDKWHDEPPAEPWAEHCSPEMRLTLRAMK